jgi:hypothetical protein
MTFLPSPGSFYDVDYKIQMRQERQKQQKASAYPREQVAAIHRDAER